MPPTPSQQPDVAPPAAKGGGADGHALLSLQIIEDEPGFRVEAADSWLSLHIRLDHLGSVSLAFGGNSPQAPMPLRPAACALIPPGLAPSWRMAAGLRRLVIRLPPPLLVQLSKEEGAALPSFAVREPVHDAALEHYAGLLRYELERGDPPAAFLDAMGRLVGLHVLRGTREHSSSAAERRAPELSSEQQQIIAEYVARTLPEPIVMADLAELLGLSHYQLLRRVKQSTGDTPQAYVQRLRIDMARKLLRESDASLTDIAMTLGFSSSSHFNHAFRTLVRVTPKVYRERTDLV